MAGVELWWLGQSGFRLRPADGGAVLFLDPYLLRRDDRAWQAPVGPEALAGADVVLCTHEHTDHFDRPTLQAAAAEPGAHFRLVVPRPLAEDAVALGVATERVVGMQPGEVLELDGGVRVRAVPARHGVNVSDAYTFGEELSGGLVRYLGYVVEAGGVRVYHAGDCVPYAGQVDRLREIGVDVALLPINGRDYFRETERNLVGNFDPREAARLADEMGARVLVPMHWELFERNRGYPDQLMRVAGDLFPDLTVLTFGRGARLTLGPFSA